jgi:hypothetical protein
MKQEADIAADCLKRKPAKRVSYNNTQRRPFSGEGEGKFAGKPGPTGGTMGKGGKRGY